VPSGCSKDFDFSSPTFLTHLVYANVFALQLMEFVVLKRLYFAQPEIRSSLSLPMPGGLKVEATFLEGRWLVQERMNRSYRSWKCISDSGVCFSQKFCSAVADFFRVLLLLAISSAGNQMSSKFTDAM